MKTLNILFTTTLESTKETIITDLTLKITKNKIWS